MFYYQMSGDEAMEIKKSSEIHSKTKLSPVSLMTQGYQEGKFAEGQNINCTLKLPEKQSGTNTKMKVTIYELSTSSNCTKVCLNVKSSGKPPFCSDARELYNHYGSFDIQGIWEFNLTVTTDCIPKIRLCPPL